MEIRTKSTAPIIFLGPARASDLAEENIILFMEGLRSRVDEMKRSGKLTGYVKVIDYPKYGMRYDGNELSRGFMLHPAPNCEHTQLFLKTCVINLKKQNQK